MFDRWDQLDDRLFEQVSRERLKAVQAGLQGHIGMQVMAPMWNGEIYQNYPRQDQPDYGACYWADAQSGLYAVKTKYDPTHAFRFAQEVGPPLPPGGGVGPVIVLPPWLQQALDQPITRAR